jgi:hypothetical protein
MSVFETTNPRPWTAHENRCDRCGAESFFRMSKLVDQKEVLQLFFCGHHGRKIGPAMIDWFSEDYTHEINAVAMSGAHQ